jgi:hypothetical protein
MNQFFCFRNICISIGIVIAFAGFFLSIKRERKNINQNKDVRQKGTINPSKGEVTFDLGSSFFMVVLGLAFSFISYAYFPCSANSYADNKGNSNQNLSTDSSSKRIDLDFTSDNITLARILADKMSFDRHIGVIVYNMVLVNKSKDFTTVKDVLLNFDFDGKQQSEEALNVETGVVKNMNNNKESPSLKIKMKSDTFLYLQDWHNIREKIAEGTLLHPGEILEGSGFYLLPITDIHDLNRIKNLSISVLDYSGYQSNIPIELSNPQPIKVWEFKSESFLQYSK